MYYETKTQTCDGCEHLLITPTPNPYGWFIEGERKAICEKCQAIVKDNIGLPNDCYNIERLTNCPLLMQVESYANAN